MDIDFTKLTVLVVADVIPLRKQLGYFFEVLDTGAIITAAHAKKGFELFCVHRPDLVIADMDMVPMGGLELTREIRLNSLSPNCRTPVILLTTTITAKQATEARVAGVSGLVLKPFSANDLLNHVTHVMSESRDFIDGPDYSGPNRRQKKGPDYTKKLVGGPQTKESKDDA